MQLRVGMSLVNAHNCSELAVVVPQAGTRRYVSLFRDGRLCGHRVLDVASPAGETGNTISGTVHAAVAGDGVDHAHRLSGSFVGC